MYMSNDCWVEHIWLIEWVSKPISKKFKEVKSQCDENVLVKIVYKIGNAKKV